MLPVPRPPIGTPAHSPSSMSPGTRGRDRRSAGRPIGRDHATHAVHERRDQPGDVIARGREGFAQLLEGRQHALGDYGLLQLDLVAEVVMQESGRDARFGRDGPQRRAGDALAHEAGDGGIEQALAKVRAVGTRAAGRATGPASSGSGVCGGRRGGWFCRLAAGFGGLVRAHGQQFNWAIN